MRLRGALVAVAMTVVAACGDGPAAQPDAGLACGLFPAFRIGTPISHSQCGPALELTPINQYAGPIASIQAREDAVVLIDGDCTGTLIAATAGPIVLTAGHCVGLGNRALLAFNVEDNPDGDPLVTNGTVIERADEPDYALIQLDQLPATTPTLLTSQPSDRVAIVQHPRGGRKVIAEGNFARDCGGVIAYTDLDTLAGSSGSGVLNQQGYLYGVHNDGNCAASGANTGWSSASIVAASAYLVDADLAAR